MKKFFLLASLSLSFPALTKATGIICDTIKSDPVEVVQRQVDAYNNRNINDFVNTYADSVKFYNFPDKYLGKGKEFIRKGYTNFFLNNEKLKCVIVERIIQGSTIIDKENITVSDQRHFENVAIYKVENGKILTVYFLR